MADQIWPNGSRLLDANGDPLSGAKVYAYESGTATLLTTYTDSTLTVANSNPVLTDAQGLIPPLWYDGSVDVKVNATDASDVVLNGFPIDPAPTFKGGSAASDSSFTANSDVPANNVQEAIEHVGAAATALDARMDTAEADITAIEANIDTVEADIVTLQARDLAGLVLIEEATASNSAAVEFTGFDATKFYGYVFVLMNVLPVSTGTDLRLRYSADGGTTFVSTATYAWTGTEADATPSAASLGGAPVTEIVVAYSVYDNNAGVNGRVNLFAPDVDKRTHATYHTSYHAVNHKSLSGAGRTTANMIVDAVQFSFATGNIDSGTILMFGLAR